MSVSELETVRSEVSGGVARIVLNRPTALNAWTRQLGEDLRASLEDAAADPAVRCVVITGAGRGFSSGADLKAGGEFSEDGVLQVEGQLRDVYNPLISRVRRLEKPVIASVNGAAVGIGCSLALACDLVLAAESAYFLLSFVNIGLTVDGGASLTLPARVGHARAFEMAYLGERITAGQALEWGLVNEVVADDQLARRTEALAARLAKGPTGSFAAIKRTINARWYDGFEEVLELETTLQQQRAASADFREGLMAFLEKREPRFPGG